MAHKTALTFQQLLSDYLLVLPFSKCHTDFRNAHWDLHAQDGLNNGGNMSVSVLLIRFDMLPFLFVRVVLVQNWDQQRLVKPFVEKTEIASER